MEDNGKQVLEIADFKLFCETLKAVNKLSDAAKLTFNEAGMTIYSKKNQYARLEVSTNAVISKIEVSVCIPELGSLIRLLGTAEAAYEGEQPEVSFIIDLPFFKIESKRFKTKLTSCKEEIISASVSQKVKTVLTPVFEFATSTALIKAINAHSFVFQDADSARIYLAPDQTMENNVLYATIGNEANRLNNSVTLKAGLIEFGSIPMEKIILNFDRLNLLNIVPADTIKVALTDKNVLLVKPELKSKVDGIYCDMSLYCSILRQ